MISGQIIPLILGIRPEFLLFALTLLGVALFHRHSMIVALIGLCSILAFKFIFDPAFNLSEHLFGHVSFLDHVIHKDLRVVEWSTLLNLLGLLLCFAILSRHFEESGVPEYLPKLLPNDWKGPLVLLIAVFVLSSFLDNIAAALIGGSIAIVVFKRKVHLGYIAAIVAASNAGGSGSVIGDTTTTLMWIEGVHPFNVFHGYIAALTALAFFSVFASIQQDKYQRIQKDTKSDVVIDWTRLGIVVMILLMTIATNVFFNFPALGVWIALIIGGFIRKTDWAEAKRSIGGSIFLIALVTCASIMPVNELPVASWQTAFSLGFVSSVFDNIPLTKMALEQNGYDWGMLAYAVGFGGSMIWFGSSAGVAITNKFHEARSVFGWLKSGWHILVAYILGFFVLLFVMGWEPQPLKSKQNPEKTTQLIENHSQVIVPTYK